MVQFFDSESFFQQFREPMFYVGLLKTDQAWFPLCLVSQPEVQRSLDTLFVSASQHLMQETLDQYAAQVPQAQVSFVQFLTRDEIRNLLRDYGLNNIALIVADVESLSCECGCGCS